jgi:dTDP-glucose 4,6-dehydratase
MNLAGKRILVTGADGFIGSHLVERLLELGYLTKAFVFYNSYNSYGWLDVLAKKELEKIEIFPGDVRDPHGVKDAVQGCDVVMHLAALIGIPFSYHSPDCYVDTNVKGTLNVLHACRDLGVEKLIITSTSEVYGTALYVPIDEKHPLQGQSPYSATKIGADQLALSFYRSFDLPVSIIRPFNTYGPRQSARAVIPTVITQIVAGGRKLHLGNLNPTRDFTFVLDTVNAFIKMAECDASIGEVVNIGSNFEISIADLAAKIVRLMCSDAETVTQNARKRPEKSEVDRLLADNQKARDLLGWTPTHSLDEGLRTTIEWFRDPDNIRKYKTEIYNL